jgi:hypothetical protein
MRRLLILLPICLLLAPEVPPRSAAPSGTQPEAPPDTGSNLPDEQALAHLARTDPIAFLQCCLKRYQREVRGYHGILEKQERLHGTLYPPERVEVWFQEEPFRVRLDWHQGARQVLKSLYAEGENHNRVLVRATGPILSRLPVPVVVERDPDSPDARRAGRVPLTEFGIKWGSLHTLGPWQRALRRHALHLKYLGEQRVPELAGRVCHVFHRTRYEQPEDDGICDSTVYIDRETWLQVGAVVKDASGQLIASYFFHDIQINPDFPPDTFTRQGLLK